MSRPEGALVRFPAGSAWLEGNLAIPPRATGVVVFAHGSGSSRHSPRNRAVAASLREQGLGTLLIDLLTLREESEDEATGDFRFDVDLLADRLVAATEWLEEAEEARALAIGYFGASTGAAAALLAAARKPAVRAVVSRGGRPDLAGSALGRVRAPALLIVGSKDLPVLELNRAAFEMLRGEKRLEVVPGASHLFEEPGTLDAVAGLAGRWFRRFLAGPAEPFAAPPGRGREATPRS